MSDTMDPRLAGYADGQLDADEAAIIEARLTREPELAHTVDVHRQMTALLRAACAEQFYAGGAVYLPRRAKPQWRQQIAGLAIAACAAGILGFGIGRETYPGQTPRDELLTEVAEYHDVFSRETQRLVELSAAQSDELREWIRHRIGRDIAIPDLDDMGLHFAGGRMYVVDGKPTAALYYTRSNGRPVGLCITEAVAHPDSQTVDLATRKELMLAAWVDHGYQYVVVGQIDQGTARDIASRARSRFAG